MAASVEQMIKNLPEHLQKYYAELYEKSHHSFQRPYEAFPGTRNAAIPEEINRARTLAGEPSSYGPAIREARDLTRKGRSFPEASGDYMNPYAKYVAEAIDRDSVDASRQMLDDMDSRFASLGHHGSTRHREVAGKFLRDIKRDAMEQKQRALASGFSEGARAFAADEARNLESAKMLSGLGAEEQRGKMLEVDALSKMGDYFRQNEQMVKDIEYQDFLRQQAYEQNKIATQLANLGQIPYPDITTTVGVVPPQPILNPIGSIGNMATSLLGARMGRKRGGSMSPAIYRYHRALQD